MTHKDIYTKFMIEYDKANVTSSYPSLTEYEVATVLDKAYNALIAQKVTGNNIRRVSLEGDLKAIQDIAPLITTHSDGLESIENLNVAYRDLPKDLLYFVSGKLTQKCGEIVPALYRVITSEVSGQTPPAVFDPTTSYTLEEVNTKLKVAYPDVDPSTYELEEDLTLPDISMPDGYNYTMILKSPKTYVDYPADNIQYRPLPIKLVDHNTADKFIISAHNLPWIKTPVCYIENDTIYIVYDSINTPELDNPYKAELTYIKVPNKFAKELEEDTTYLIKQTYFDYTLTTPPDPADSTATAAYYGLKAKLEHEYWFECNDTVAEELISLAIAFALENVESPRLNSKLSMRGFEA